MAKLCALFVLAALAVVAHGMRFDPPKLTRIGKYFAEDAEPRVTIDDPICKKGDGLYPHPSECTRYVACRDGVSQVRTCPEGFKFDSRRHCTPEEDADCGKPQALRIKIESPSADLTCPQEQGTFPYPGDCRKYITCDNWQPTSWLCNGQQVYEQGVGCWDGGVCHDSPQGQAQVSADVTCPENYGYFPYSEDCHKFLVCVDGVPTLHTCPEGHVYSDNVGCVEGTVCPKTSEDSRVTCRKANGLYPHDWCIWYYKCVNFRPHIKECPKNTAFDPKKEKCTKAMYSKCMTKNDLQDLMRAE